MSEKFNMEKSDIGEMLGIVLLAKESEFGKVQIDTLDAEEVVTLAYESFDLKEENQKLRETLCELLKSSVYADAEGFWRIDQDDSKEVENSKLLLERTK